MCAYAVLSLCLGPVVISTACLYPSFSRQNGLREEYLSAINDGLSCCPGAYLAGKA